MRWTAADAELSVLTFKEGLLSAVAHDLKIRVGTFTLEAIGDPNSPASVSLEVQPASLSVICAMQQGRERRDVLSASNRSDIEKSLARHVLPAKRFPHIRFVSSSVSTRTKKDSWNVAGALSMGAATHPVDILVRREGQYWLARARIDQRHWAIEPFKAMLGTLRVAAEVQIEARVPCRS